MKNLTRIAAALVALAVAAPALPCGLMQHEADAGKTPPVVAQTPKAEAAQPRAQKAQPQKVARKTTAQARTVAKN